MSWSRHHAWNFHLVHQKTDEQLTAAVDALADAYSGLGAEVGVSKRLVDAP